MNKMLFAIFSVFLLFHSTAIESVEAIMWHRYIGADVTANGVFISKVYSPTVDYTQFSLSSGVEDNDYFAIQNSNEVICSGAIAQGSYTISLTISDGTDSVTKLIPFEVVQGSAHPKLLSGYSQSLVITSSGDVYCYGAGAEGVLGNGSTSNVNTPYLLNGVGGPLEGESVIALSASQMTSHFLTRDGKVFSCGQNNVYQLGITSTTADITTATEVSALSSHTVVQVAAGYAFTLYLTAEGKIYGVGRNGEGQLGNSSNTNSSTPVWLQGAHSILDNEFVIAIGAGITDAHALVASGDTYAWGGNYNGQLGLGNTTHQNEPQLVTFSSPAKFITTDSHIAMMGVILETGVGYTTGRNNVGQLGRTGSATSYLSLASPLDTESLHTIQNNWENVLVITDAGAVYGFGSNSSNQLGPGSTSNRSSPTLIDASEFNNETVTQVMMGNDYSSVLTTTGKLFCIGNNSTGQLGLGNNTSRSSYTQSSLDIGANTRIVTYNTPSDTTVVIPTSTFAINWTSYQLSGEQFL